MKAENRVKLSLQNSKLLSNKTFFSNSKLPRITWTEKRRGLRALKRRFTHLYRICSSNGMEGIALSTGVSREGWKWAGERKTTVPRLIKRETTGKKRGGQIQFPVATTHNTGHTVPDSGESWLTIPCTLEIKTDQQPVKSCNEVWRVLLSIGVGIW